MSLLRIDHVQITAPRDREREARHFYGTVLGLRELEQRKTIIPSAVLRFAFDESTQVHVVLVENPFRPPLNDHLAVVVDDLDAVKKRLTDHNVGYTGHERITAQDPFGNKIEFLVADDDSGGE